MLEKENKLIELGYQIHKFKNASLNKYAYFISQQNKRYVHGISQISMNDAMAQALNKINDDGSKR